MLEANQIGAVTTSSSSRPALRPGVRVLMRDTLEKATVIQVNERNNGRSSEFGPDITRFVECLVTGDDGNTRVRHVFESQVLTTRQLRRRIGCSRPSVIGALCVLSFAVGLIF